MEKVYSVKRKTLKWGTDYLPKVKFIGNSREKYETLPSEIRKGERTQFEIYVNSVSKKEKVFLQKEEVKIAWRKFFVNPLRIFNFWVY